MIDETDWHLSLEVWSKYIAHAVQSMTHTWLENQNPTEAKNNFSKMSNNAYIPWEW